MGKVAEGQSLHLSFHQLWDGDATVNSPPLTSLKGKLGQAEAVETQQGSEDVPKAKCTSSKSLSEKQLTAHTQRLGWSAHSQGYIPWPCWHRGPNITKSVFRVQPDLKSTSYSHDSW